MPKTITVLDQSAERVAQSLELHVSSGSLTLRELIRIRVQNEVEDFNRKNSDIFTGLVQPTDTEVMLNGYRFRSRRTLDWQAQYESAIKAFEGNGFFVILDDQQIENLDEELFLSEKSTVRFLRLVPLIGG